MHRVDTIIYHDGEQIQYRQVDYGGVINIIEVMPEKEGHKLYYDIYYKDGRIERVFDIKSVNLVPIITLI
jgi:hypothetical protein